MKGATLELEISSDGVVRGGRVANNILDDIAKSAAFTSLQLQKLNSNFDKNAKSAVKSSQANNKVIKNNNKLEKSFKDVTKSLKNYIAGYIGFTALRSFTADAIEARLELDRLELSLKTVTGSSNLAAKELAFVRRTAKELGLDFRAVSGSYGQLLAAAKSVNISLEVAQKLFKNVSAASRANAMTNEQTKGTFLAFTQIMSKGKLSMEEIRQQLGERMPIAMETFATSLGISTEEFQKLVGEGKLYAEDVIPLVAEEFGKFTKDAKKASGDLQSKFNELNTAWFDFKTSLIDGKVLEGLKDILSVAKQMVDAFVQGSREWGKLASKIEQGNKRRSASGNTSVFESPGASMLMDLFAPPGSPISGVRKRPKSASQKTIEDFLGAPQRNPKSRAKGVAARSSGNLLSSLLPGVPGLTFQLEQEKMLEKMYRGQLAIEAGAKKAAGSKKKKTIPPRESAIDMSTFEQYFDYSRMAEFEFEKIEDNLDDLKDKNTEVFNVMAEAQRNWANSFTDTFVDAITGAESSFSGFINSILKDLLRLSVQQNITKPLFEGLGGGGGFLGKIFGGSKHSGGVVPGRPGEERLMMLQAGERVISNGQNQAMGGMGGMNVNIYNNAGAQVQATQRQGSNGVELDITIDKIVAEKLSSPSRSSSALKNVYGLRPKGY